MRHLRILAAALFACTLSAFAAKPPAGLFSQGVTLYNAGRNSEAVELFEQAIRKKDNAASAQTYIDRIRKETVERIRNRALTGVNKSNWQNKFYFMNQIDNRVRVGISVQEVFEQDTTSFRPGALTALAELAKTMAKAETARFEVELINELRQETQPNPTLTAQQLTTLYSFLALSARSVAPNF